jgi:hypothetical protein
MKLFTGFVASIFGIWGIILSSVYVYFGNRSSLDKVVSPLMEATASSVATSVTSELLGLIQMEQTVSSLMSRKTPEEAMLIFSGKYDRFLSAAFDLFNPYYITFGFPGGRYYGFEFDTESPKGRIISYVQNTSTGCFEDYDFTVMDTKNISSFRPKGYCGYNPTSRPWYIGATTSKTGFWTNPYVFAGTKPPKLGITYASPVYNSKGDLLLVAATDVVISEFYTIMQKAKAEAFRSSAKTYHAIQIFIVHGNGDLVPPIPRTNR